MKKCIICGKQFSTCTNKKYCSLECRKKAYKNYCFSSSESQEKYRDKIMDEEGLQDYSDYNLYFREKTANNRGMTTTEYNAYLEERKAKKLGVSVQELRHYTYLSKKNRTTLADELNMGKDEYKRRMSRKNEI